MKKIICILLAIVLMSALGDTQVFAEENKDNTAVRSLLKERAKLICAGKWDETENINQQLEALGVEKLSFEEVKALCGETDSVMPYITVPLGTNAEWYSERTYITYKGVEYEIQTLYAQPGRNLNSTLAMSGEMATKSTYGWRVGIMNGIKAIGTATVGAISGVDKALTVYEMLEGFVSGITPTTELKNVNVAYTYSHVTTVSFKYIKVKGQSDDKQVLTYISSTGDTKVNYQYSGFEFDGGSLSPVTVSGKYEMDFDHDAYDSNTYAIKAYTDPYSPSRAFLSSVVLSGIESKTIVRIYPARPEFPTQL